MYQTPRNNILRVYYLCKWKDDDDTKVNVDIEKNDDNVGDDTRRVMLIIIENSKLTQYKHHK